MNSCSTDTTALINEHLILLDQNMEDKGAVVTALGKTLAGEERIHDEKSFEKDVYERELLATTAIGDYIAIPHAISTSVDHASLVFIRLKDAINWNSEDKVRYVFGIAVPKENKNNQHLKILSALARKLLDENFKKALLEAGTKEECIHLLKVLEANI